MSYNLPDGVSQDMIDRYYGGAPDWICGDPDCQTGWVGDFETYPCGVEACEVIGCDDCRAKCSNCSKNCCTVHRRLFDEGDSKPRIWCVECITERKAMETV